MHVFVISLMVRRPRERPTSGPSHQWEGVRSQIINAMNMGMGTIEIDRKGDRVVYVYSPFLAVSWVETGV
jgi:hypothetical protein